jgi:hypothetical protein
MFYLTTLTTMRRDLDRQDDSQRRNDRRDDDSRDHRNNGGARGEDRGRNEGRFENPYRLHEQDHGNNSRRGNYRTDSHFNSGYGRRADLDYDHQNDFNNNPGRAEYENRGENRPGGARYTGDDWYGTFNRSDNQYGYVRQPQGRSPYREYGLRDYGQDEENRRGRDAHREDDNFRRTARNRNSDAGDYSYLNTRSGQDMGGQGDPVGQRQNRPDFRDRREDRYEQDRDTRRNDTAYDLRNDRRNGY